MQIIHHGAVNGVTGSCHELNINPHSSILIDCGLFQGAETAGETAADQLQIEFDLSHVTALIVTHCHIDDVGRIPYLLAAGFNKPIYAITATAALLPMVIRRCTQGRRHPQSAISNQQSAISNQQSAISNQQSAISNQ